MSSPSPTAQSFRLIFRRPAVSLAEIAWRWSFAAAAIVLVTLFLFEYMESLAVKTLDRLMLGSGQPILIARAIHRIFHGSGLRFTQAAVILVLALTVAWILLASFGRAATTKALVDEFEFERPASRRSAIWSLISLNFLRAAVTLAAAIVCLGAILFTRSTWGVKHLTGGDYARFLVLVWFLAWLAWSVLNWLLSITAVPVIAARSRSLPAFSSAVSACVQRPGPFLAVGSIFGLVRLGVLIAALIASLITLGVLGARFPRAMVLLEWGIFAGYCAIADFLYIGRLSAYVLLLTHDGSPTRSDHGAVPGTPAAPAARVDQEESILSDVPTIAG